MIYSKSELDAWWKALTEYDKERLFEVIQGDLNYQRFASSLESIWRAGKPLTENQLQALRKWER